MDSLSEPLDTLSDEVRELRLRAGLSVAFELNFSQEQ
jgi:hypothetical protein